MTAFDRAWSDESLPESSFVGSQAFKTVAGRIQQFLTDVWSGVRLVSHNTLAMVGLLAVLGAVFLVGSPNGRHDLESRALTWLNERVNERQSLSADDADRDVLLAMAEPEAINRATAADPTELNRQQALVAFWISRRYNVAPEPISRLVQEAWAAGQKANLDPNLVLAVMAIESGFNPFAQSHVGAQGLMQVMTRIHQDKYQIFGGQHAAFDPVTNLRVGVQVLKDCIRRAGSLQSGLKYYVGAANLADDGGYATKVMAEFDNLRQVAAGRKVPVNVSLPAATVVQTTAPISPASSDHAAPAAIPAPAASETAPVARRPEQLALAP
ncbi:MAG: lytic transglycosylase domain-containing protein [Burkholderiales bacterium]|nr:lytic transglycosylase domain-containing protein [Burkholderiales bacterium]MDE2076701.1 lytic transglycosylase domain-containing protein [Burkholderiales bacterium]MDE2431676.1 lytic transglycosylase domain-containing protein [Burkholderiales bacterium]